MISSFSLPSPANPASEKSVFIVFSFCSVSGRGHRERRPRTPLHRVAVGVGPLRVEALVAPDERHHIRVPEVLEVVGVARRHVYHLYPVPGDGVLYHLRLRVTHVTEPDHASPAHHDELLVLAVVPVVALCDVRPGDVHRHLPPVRRADQLREAPPLVAVRHDRVAEPVLGKVRQVGRVELPRERVADVRDPEGLPRVPEPLQQLHYMPEGHAVVHRHAAVAPVRVLLSREGPYQLVDHVVDVLQVEGHVRVVDLDRQAFGDVVAERRDDAVVVRAAPLPEEVREPVHEHLRAGLLRVPEHQLLPGPLALPVGVVERRLDGARYHHRALVAVFLQGVEQDGREPEVPPHELLRVLRTVHPGEVVHEVRVPAVDIQLGRVAVDVVLVDGEILGVGHGVPPRLAVADVAQLGHKVPPYEALSPRNQYFHLYFLFCGADIRDVSACNGYSPGSSAGDAVAACFDTRSGVLVRGCRPEGLFRPYVPRLRPRDQPEVLLYEAQAHQLLLHPLDVKPPGVVAVVVLDGRDLLVSLHEELVVVQIPRVARDAEIVTHVDSPGHLLPGHEGLVQLLPVPRADDLHLRLPVFRVDLRVDLLQGRGEGVQGGRRGLLHEQVAVVAVSERVHHQVDRIVEGHHEPRHVRVGYRDGLALHHLLDPQGDHRTAGGHHVPVPRAADRRGGSLPELAPLRYRHLLHHRLGDPHRVDGVGGLVRGENHHVPHPVLDGGQEHVVSPLHVRTHRLHREELAARDLLQGGCREHVVHPAHRDVHALLVAHVPDEELHLRVLEHVTHVVLLLLVPREDADLLDVAVQEATEHGVPETARAACYQQDFVFEY